MSRFCALQRLMGDYPVIEEYTNRNVKADGGNKNERSIKNAIVLGTEEYEALLSFVRVEMSMPEARDCNDLPHPKSALVLRPMAITKPHCRISEKMMISVLKPNNCIKYVKDERTCYGLVQQIYNFKDPMDQWQTVLMINPIQDLYGKDLQSPTRFFRKLCFLLKCVVGKVEATFVYVSPVRVRAMAAYRMLLKDTFSVPEDGIILRPYDYDSQLAIV